MFTLPVDPARAAAAFQAGMDAVDRAAEKFSEILAANKAQVEASRAAFREKVDAQSKRKAARSEKVYQANIRARELKDLRRNRFFGLSRAEEAELLHCTRIADSYDLDDSYSLTWDRPRGEVLTVYVDSLKGSFESLKAICTVASDVVQLPSGAAEQMYHLEINPDAYVLKKYPFNSLAKGN